MSDTDDSSRSGQGADTAQGNWLTRNFWIAKGLLAVAVLGALGYASLAAFDGEMANVLWAMSITTAVLVALVQALFGGLQAVQAS